MRALALAAALTFSAPSGLHAGAAPAVSEPAPPPASAGLPRILCVSRSLDGREFLAAALAAKDIEARVGGPEIIPDTLKGLIPYDCLVLSNIPRSSLGDAKMKILVRYVRDYGGGLVVFGGPGSLGPAYRGTPLEEILPVTITGEGRFGKDAALPLCIILLMDKSGSMEEGFGQKESSSLLGALPSMDQSKSVGEGVWGKIMAVRESAEELVKQLRADDMLGVIAFDTMCRVLAPLGPVGEDRRRVLDLIGRIEPGGDTALAKPLEEALRQMQGSLCRVKHVILVTDGKTKDLSMYDYRGLISEYTRSGVTISAMDIGRKDGSEFLRALALGTGGDYTHVRDVKTLPLAVLRDARKAAVESGFINETVVPKLGEKSPLLKGIRQGQIPEVRGYIVMTAKSGADVALYTDVRGLRDPLLAAWRRGYGKTVVWASDAEGHWAGGAGSAKKSGEFWARVVRWAMRERPESR